MKLEKSLHLLRRTVAGFALLLVLAISTPPTVHGQSSPSVAAQIGQAYAAVLAAEQSGGNVTSLVAKLNSAVSLLQQADLINGTSPAKAQVMYSQASALASQVIQDAPAVGSSGKAAVTAVQLDLVIETGVLGVLAVLAYLYVPRIYWSFWLRTREDWRVEKS